MASYCPQEKFQTLDSSIHGFPHYGSTFQLYSQYSNATTRWRCLLFFFLNSGLSLCYSLCLQESFSFSFFYNWDIFYLFYNYTTVYSEFFILIVGCFQFCIEQMLRVAVCSDQKTLFSYFYQRCLQESILTSLYQNLLHHSRLHSDSITSVRTFLMTLCRNICFIT